MVTRNASIGGSSCSIEHAVGGEIKGGRERVIEGRLFHLRAACVCVLTHVLKNHLPCGSTALVVRFFLFFAYGFACNRHVQMGALWHETTW